MKKLITILIVAVVYLSSTFTNQAVAQCDPVLDQNQPSWNLGTAGEDQWQSFTAGISGKLSKIALHKNGIQNVSFTLTVYEGEGTGGNVLFSKLYNLGSMSSVWFDVDIPDASAPSIVSGKKYTFRIQGPTLYILCNRPKNYSGGTYWSNHYGYPDWNLTFRTYVKKPVPCGIVLDQSQPNWNLGTAGEDQWQSFTAGKSGGLGKVSLHKNGIQHTKFTFTVYEGEGIGGNVLFTKYYDLGTLSSVWFDVNIPESSAPQLVKGKKYTFRIQGSSLYILCNRPKNYSGGTYWSNHYGYPDWNLTFKTHVHTYDMAPPVAKVKNPVVSLGSNGNVTVTAAQVNNGSYDDCGIKSMSVSPTTFDCDDVSINPGDVNIPSPAVRGFAGRTITFSNVNLNSSGNELVVRPGAAVSLSLNWVSKYTSSYCPGCIQQFYVGISGVFGECLYSGNTSSTRSGSRTVNFTAPSEPGVYYVQANSSLQYNCVGVGYSKSGDGAIGVVIVAPEVTLTIKDNACNTTTKKAFVFVEDNTPPVVISQAIYVDLDENGEATITANDVNNGTHDNCGIKDLSIDKDYFTCENIGDNRVTLTATDNSGNTSNRFLILPVRDKILPVARTKNITVYLDANGKATITPQQIDNGSTDNCGIDRIQLSKYNFSCANLGANTINLLVTDKSGNTASAPATVTVIDNIKPVVIGKTFTAVLDGAGHASITPADVDGGSYDNCAIKTLKITRTSVDCSQSGTTIPVGITAIDQSGNTTNGVGHVKVVDKTPPTVKTKDITVNLDAQGRVVIGPGSVNYGSYDVCGIATIKLSKTTFNCADVGPNTVTLTVVDRSGNSASANAKVTVRDITKPIAKTRSFTRPLNSYGRATISVSDVNNGSWDACGLSKVSLDNYYFTCNNLGQNIVKMTVIDKHGNYSYANATINIIDNIKPVVKAKTITVYLDPYGKATITPQHLDAGSYDNCGIKTLTISRKTFTCSDAGRQYQVILTATDQSGNQSYAPGYVYVRDNTPPTVRTRDIAVNLGSNGSVTISPSAVNYGSYDACGIGSLRLSKSTFTCYDVGTNIVTLTVYDRYGNYAKANAKVTVRDVTKPTVKVRSFTRALDYNGKAVISAGQVNYGSYDACGISNMDLNRTTFTCNNLGPNTVRLTVTDKNGNINYAYASINIIDNMKPVVKAKSISVYLDPYGKATITPQQIDAGSYDNCGITKYKLNRNTFDCSMAGLRIPVVLTVYDKSGNYSSTTAYVYVYDKVPPVARVRTLNIPLDQNGKASISASQVNYGSSDACGIASMNLSKTAFYCSNVGANTVLFTVYDKNGNKSSVNATVNIYDPIKPIAKAKEITVKLDGTGKVAITPQQVNKGSYDNCAITKMLVSPNKFTCSNVGRNYVRLTVYDKAGNYSSAYTYVTVVDVTPPTIIAKNITVELNANGNAVIVPDQVNNGSYDNCGLASLALSKTTFDCSNLGKNQVTLRGTDKFGNTSYATAIVTIEDNIPPVVETKDIEVTLDANGYASLTADDINDGSYDNCTIKNLYAYPNEFGCNEQGMVIPVMLIATDQSGNLSNEQANVRVLDLIAPTAICKDLTIYLDANGEATIDAMDVNNGSYDNCSVASIELNKYSFNCSDVGANNVEMTVTDRAGNQSTCMAVVTVVDNINPTAIAKDITIELDANGQASIQPSDVDDGSYDNCTIADLSVTPNQFDCSNYGINEVTLTVIDANNNTSTATANVKVTDVIAPTVVTQNITIELDANGAASISTDMIDNGSYDNCGIIHLSLDKTDFDCSNTGENTVVLTVTDIYGNVATANAVVTVNDNIAPTAVCQDITIKLNAEGAASITEADIDNGSFDNCGIAELSLSKYEFNCTNVGDNPVTLTVVDLSGNESTCTANVSVVDEILPTAVCQDVMVQLDDNGEGSITVEDVDNGSFDNCAVASMTIDKSDFNCSTVGANTVTLTVTDVNGNVTTCTSNVVVFDDVAPTAICQNVTVELDENGYGSITPQQIDNGSFDNCEVESLSLDVSEFSCDDVGENPVTLTVTDVNGNTATCNAVVTVEDNIFPTISFTVNPNNLWPPNNKMQTINAAVTYDDNCDVSVYLKSITISDGGEDKDIENADYNTADFEFDLRKKKSKGPEDRVYTIVYVAEDASGNKTEAEATVIVPNSNKRDAVFEEEVTIFSDASLSVFPNPTADIVNINFNANVEGNMKLRLMNLAGKTLMNVDNGMIQNYSDALDLSDLPSGTYLLEVQFNLEIKLVKVIKY